LGIDDDPGVHPMTLGMFRVTQAPGAVGIAHYPLELVISLERVAARGDEVQHPVPRRFVEPGVSETRTDLGEQIGFAERRGASTGHHVLREHVEPPRAKVFAVTLALVDRVL